MSSALGRPRSSSREILAEAACELFLEQGFAATSITDIAGRAGVSRSSFFNYFASKSDVLWASLDERIDAFEVAMAGAGDTASPSIRDALLALGEGVEPDALALAIANAEPMAVAEDLAREAAVRQARIAAAVRRRLAAAGADVLVAAVAGAAHGGAVLAAIEHWAHAGAGSSALVPIYRTALDAAAATLPGATPALGSTARRPRRAAG
ncbi:TetR/AcrR family transcriptional regulator [Microbacterium sp.]|uniref:TetR/AcrR family transcriptional regulator n=1 Tax=Microbacterium sp. TaxID=51671 RepID=UPI003A85515D